MPIYEYKCKNCHKLFEYIQKVNDALLTECEQCHGTLEKLVSSTSFQLKGTGWYVTDFKNTDKKTNTSGETSAVDTQGTTQTTESTPSQKEPAKKLITESTPTTKES